MDDGTRIPEDVEAFLRAARSGEVAKCSAMLEGKSELLNSQEAGGYGALHFAAFNGDVPMLTMLLAHKPNLDLENYDDNTPLIMAVKGRQLESIRMLVNAGADVNKETGSGSTAAHHAAAMGYLDCLRLLVQLGAKTAYPASEAGSLLHWACHSGDVNCVGAMLYEFHVPIDTPDKHGGTALFTALFMKKTEVVEFLLEHGANPNVTITADGTSALHIAVEHGNTECVRLLCSCGADPNAKNTDGESPLDIATKNSDTAALKELTKTCVPKEKRTEEAARFKNQGNKVFAEGENVKAAKFYTLAIHLDITNHVFFSNRSACYFNQQYYTGAYWDSQRCIALNPKWPKGYLRRSATELAMKRYDDAITTATEGLKLESSNKDLLHIKEEATKLRKQ